MNQLPLVSVCIPAYNHEDYIEQCIYSVINQTYKNIELIIIDDGSKDATYKKIQELEKKCRKRFKRFIFQTQKNQGACITQNKLTQLSNGKYLAFIASDDKYMPNAIEDLVEFLDNNRDFVLAVGKNYIIDANGQQCYWDKKRRNVYDKKKAKWFSFSDFLIQKTKIDFTSFDFGSYASLVRCNHIPNGYLTRKSIIKKIGDFPQEALLEDHWLMFQLAKYGKMKYLSVPTFYYRWHSSNTIKQKHKMKDYALKTYQWEEKYLKTLPDKKWLKIFHNVRYIKKPIVDLWLIKIYKYYDNEYKYKIIQIGQWKCQFSCKSR